MVKPLVIGNWKMNGSYVANDALLTQMLPVLSEKAELQVVLCPPFPYLSQVGQALSGSRVWLGAQTANPHPSGAHTGEVSVLMLRELGCEYVLVGHSERRQNYGEADQDVVARFIAIQSAGLTPVLCVGETLEQREAGQTESVVGAQIKAVLEAEGRDCFDGAVVAYEPVWAIGTGKTATPEQAQQVHAFIRSLLASHSEVIASRLPILYGGSVKPDNAEALARQPDVNGALVGGAALDAAGFISICSAFEAKTNGTVTVI